MEKKFDINTWFYGDLKRVDDSFDHEHGTQPNISYEVVNFQVIQYFGDIDHDITLSIEKHPLYDYYKDWFLEQVKDDGCLDEVG